MCAAACPHPPVTSQHLALYETYACASQWAPLESNIRTAAYPSNLKQKGIEKRNQDFRAETMATHPARLLSRMLMCRFASDMFFSGLDAPGYQPQTWVAKRQ